MTKQIAAGIYVRISRDSEGLGLGVKRQREDCATLAERLGWRVLDVYEDNDKSASSGKPRPAYERLVADVDAGRIQGVVVWDVDRLTRSPRELEDVIDFADAKGLQLASVGGDIDLSTVQGRGMARMKGVFARMEIEGSSRRLRAKHAELAAAGKHIGPRPFGWDLDNGELTINHAEAAVLRECASRVLKDEGLWRIANDLNARGITTSTGKPWQTQVLRRVLLRWRNCGIRTHKGKEAATGQWEPLIDRETHERVVAKLTDPSRRTNNRGTAVRYLLTSKASCGACGKPVVGTNKFTYDVKGYRRKDGTQAPSKTRVYAHTYKCPHAGCHGVTRNMEDVDAFVSGVVVRVLERDGVRVLGGDPAAAENARERIDALEAKLALAADEFAADRITMEQMQRINSTVRPQLDSERDRLQRAMPSDALTEFAGAGAAAAWERADVETKRRMLDVLNLDIVIEPLGAGNGHRPVAETVTVRPKAAVI